MTIDGVEKALEMAVDLYAPVLVPLIETWKPFFGQDRILTLTHEELIETRSSLVVDICRGSQLPIVAENGLHSGDQHKSCTYHGVHQSKLVARYEEYLR
jgi:hypothetical protein